MKKKIIIIVVFILVALFCAFAIFYASAFFSIRKIEGKINSSIQMQAEIELPENCILEENEDKIWKELTHIDRSTLPVDYYLDGGISLPLIYPCGDGKYKMKYLYEYKAVNAQKNELLQKKDSELVTIIIDRIDGEWQICDVVEKKPFMDLMLEAPTSENAVAENA